MYCSVCVSPICVTQIRRILHEGQRQINKITKDFARRNEVQNLRVSYDACLICAAAWRSCAALQHKGWLGKSRSVALTMPPTGDLTNCVGLSIATSLKNIHQFVWMHFCSCYTSKIFQSMCSALICVRVTVCGLECWVLSKSNPWQLDTDVFRQYDSNRPGHSWTKDLCTCMSLIP